jgi:hypothetical protein
MWESPTMTAVADNKKRVTIRAAKPGDRFDVQVAEDGKVILTPLAPAEKKVPIVKPIRTKEGFLMFPPGKGPDRAAIRAAIREDRDKYQS